MISLCMLTDSGAILACPCRLKLLMMSRFICSSMKVASSSTRFLSSSILSSSCCGESIILGGRSCGFLFAYFSMLTEWRGRGRYFCFNSGSFSCSGISRRGVTPIWYLRLSLSSDKSGKSLPLVALMACQLKALSSPSPLTVIPGNILGPWQSQDMITPSPSTLTYHISVRDHRQGQKLMLAYNISHFFTLNQNYISNNHEYYCILYTYLFFFI